MASKTGRKVFIVNLGHYDYSTAGELGELVHLTKGRVNIMDLDQTQQDIQAALDSHDFGPQDYLLVSGHPILNAFALGYWLVTHGAVNLVYWDSYLRQYCLRREDFTRKEPVTP